MGLFVCGGEAMGGRVGVWRGRLSIFRMVGGPVDFRCGADRLLTHVNEPHANGRSGQQTGSRLPRKLSSSRWRWCCGTINLTLLPKSGRADQAARRKPAGTERQVEPTTGAQFQCQRSAPSALPLRSAHGGFILSGPRSSSALAFARAFEVPYQLRQFVIFSIEVGHR